VRAWGEKRTPTTRARRGTENATQPLRTSPASIMLSKSTKGVVHAPARTNNGSACPTESTTETSPDEVES
jgi:hypothetical protein